MLFDNTIKLLIVYNNNSNYYYFMRKLSKINRKWYRILRNIRYINANLSCNSVVLKDVNKFFKKLCSFKLNISSDFKCFDLKLKSNIRYLSINNYSNYISKIKNKNLIKLKKLKKIDKFKNLYFLKLDGVEIDTNMLYYFQIKSIKVLYLCDISLITCNFFKNFSNLHTLKMISCYDTNMFKYLENLHTLQIIDIDDDELNILNNCFKYLKNLKNLDLSSNYDIISTNNIFKYLGNLKILNLRNCFKINDDNFNYLKNLEELDITHCHDIISVHKILKYCPKLRILHMCSSHINLNPLLYKGVYKELYKGVYKRSRKRLHKNPIKYIKGVNIHIELCNDYMDGLMNYDY